MNLNNDNLVLGKNRLNVLSVNVDFNPPAPVLSAYVSTLLRDINRFDDWFKINGRLSRVTPILDNHDIHSSFAVNNLVVQSLDTVTSLRDLLKSVDSLKEYLGTRMPRCDTDFCVKMCEDVCILMYHLVEAKDMSAYTIAIINFAKLRTGKPIIGIDYLKSMLSKFRSLFENEVQSGPDDIFKLIRGGLQRYEEIKNAPIFKKLYKFLMYILSLNLFSYVGITFDSLNYTKLEAAAKRKDFFIGPDLVHTFVDTIVFLCERGYQCMKTGSMDPIYHSGGKYDAWLKRAVELKQRAVLMNNPEPHNLDRHSFLADLDECIEQGNAMYKHALRLGDLEKKTVLAILSELIFVKATETTKRAAQKTRSAPFSILLSGASSMGKSTITDILFHHYGKIKNLPVESEFKYTRNFADEFWSGFNSAQWCIILDDVAFLNPAKAMSDLSLMEIIQVVNNVPFVPNQAELADKGRTPVMAKLVIATTNTEHLNAGYYFSCPLAVRRRLPFVVDIHVKEEYVKDGVMLDHTKIPVLKEGEYPDYWEFDVYRVIPGFERGTATTEKMEQFKSIYTFLQWFNKASDNHDLSQSKVDACGRVLHKVELCPECRIPIGVCAHSMTTQANDTASFFQTDAFRHWREHGTAASFVEEEGIVSEMEDFALLESVRDIERENLYHVLDYADTVQSHFGDFAEGLNFSWFSLSSLKLARIYVFHFFTYVYLEWRMFRLAADWSYKFPLLRKYWKKWMMGPSNRSFLMRSILMKMGNDVENSIGRVPFLYTFIGLLTGFLVVYKITSFFTKKKTFVGDVQDRVDSGRRPQGSDDVESVWYKNDFQLKSFDVPTPAMDLQALKNKVIANSVHLRLKFQDDPTHERISRACCVGGQIYMANNHSFPQMDVYDLTLVDMTSKDGVSSNMRIILTNVDLVRVVESDLVFFRIRNLPSKCSLIKYFCSETVDGVFEADYYARNEDGSVFNLPVANVRLTSLNSDILATRMLSWLGCVRIPTANGDCGAVMIAKSAFGPMIFGIHYLGRDELVGTIRVTGEMIKKVLLNFDSIIVPAAPKLSTPTVKREITDLHRKSTLRFSPQGCARVYGSFVGCGYSTKSSVEPTYIAASAIKRGYVQNTGPPIMNDWRPWFNAMQDMLNPVTGLRTDVLDLCVEGYLHDVLSKLSSDDLAEVFVYDTFTAVNGAPGVQFVDKMNRNTSAGAPWCKSKRYLMTAIPATAGVDIPVQVDAEVLDRVDMCIAGYKRGERFMPVFTGHLKDEPVSFAKILAAKTRVFTGAPMDWTIVGRKYLLAVTRLIQRNRFIFESAPGTAAQSLEWEQILEHLTKFGGQHMVAGDYAKFDKRMPPCVILAAFKILRVICERAGYTTDELCVVDGIAHDTAFPLIDFHGDLVEMFGSNPSGHCLTVIINCLANCLYMRYCYFILNPLKEVSSFVSNVALMTYGDDNAMGVSPDIPWFNHTSIQSTLASIGIGYTMADKLAISVPYISIDQVSFLKRTWRFDADVGAFLCPLEHASIDKMLTMCVKSKTITPQAQSIAVLSTALREYFFYGKSVFEQKSVLLREIAEECDLNLYIESSTFPSWTSLKKDFWFSSENLSTQRLDAMSLGESPRPI